MTLKLNNSSVKPSVSQIRLSLALGLSGAFLIILGIIWFSANAFTITMGSVDGTNPIYLFLFSGVPLILVGMLSILAVPLILRKNWVLYLLIGLITISITWFLLVD